MSQLFLYGSYVFGLIMVVTFSIKAFNAPKYCYGTDHDGLITRSPYARLASPTLPKYMADRSRYTVFMTVFAVFAGLLYFMLAFILYVLPIDLPAGEAKKYMAAILSMLLLVGIIRADDIKIIKKGLFLIKWPKTLLFGMIKDWLHGFAYIPRLSRDVFNTLCYEQIDRDSPVVKENIEKILLKKYRTDIETDQYIERNDFTNIVNSGNMIAKWSRLSYFIFVVDEWSRDLKFKNQVRERSLNWLVIRENYKSLIETMARFRDKTKEMTQEEENVLKNQIDYCLADCYRLISCVVVMTSGAGEDPLRHIRDIGLKVSPWKEGFTKNGEMFRIILAMVPTIVVFSLVYTFFDPAITPAGETIKKILLYVESAFFIMLLPIILVAGLKRQMALNRSWPVITGETAYKSFFDRPLWLYTLISGIAWFVSLILMMLLIHKKAIASAGASEWESMSIFCFISFSTAFLACYRTDIPPRIYKNRLRFAVSISTLSSLHGSITALTVWTGLMTQAETASGPALWQFPLLGFALSLVIGWTLFFGKHKIEKRNGGHRAPCREPVTVIQGENRFPAVMLNKSAGGAMLRLNQARARIDKETAIEITFKDGLKKIGTIVKMDLQKLNVAYPSDGVYAH